MTNARWAGVVLLCCLSLAPSAWGGGIVPRKSNGDVVPRYDIYEITPWDPPLEVGARDPFTEVEITALFRGPDGTEHRAGAFYTGGHEWKIRFAPDVVGRWQYICTRNYPSYHPSGSSELNSGSFPTELTLDEEGSFTCVESANPGFLRQNPENKFTWVFDNGQPYWPIGLQECIGAGAHSDPFESWALEGGDRDGPWYATGTSADQYLDAYAQAGFNLFRFSPDNCSYSHYDTLDTYRIVEMAWTDELMEKLRARGYRIFYGFIGYANAFITEPDEAAKMEKVKRYLKYSVDRWGAYVDFWELLNEQDGDPKWTAMMAEYVKSIDPYHHPITDWEKGAAPQIDFHSPHWYERELEEGSDAITAEKAVGWKQYGKPVIVGEQGNDQNVWDYGSARRMRFRLWGALFSEISFVFWNTSYALNGHYMNIYLGPEERQYVRALQTFSSYLDAGMKSVPVERSTQQFRAYGLASDQRAAVYLHNRFGKNLKGESITLTVPQAGYGYWLAPDTLRRLGAFRVDAGERKITLPDFRLDLALLLVPESITAGTPTAIIDANPRFGIAPQEVVLDARRSVGVFGRKLVAYEWSLGDGEKASGPTVTHTYPAGDYFVTLTVTNDVGDRGSASLVVRAAKTMTTSRPPLALATVEPTFGKAPLTVHFRGEATALTGALAGASWDFGDGAKSDELEISHTYDQPGTYLATLAVRSDHDSATQAQFVITVEE